MKKTIIILMAVLSPLLLSTALYSKSVKQKEKAPAASDPDIIENAIIIESLSLTSTSSPDSKSKQTEEVEGSVLYDDNFDDNLKEIEKIKVPHSSPDKTKNMFLSQLKSKDPRWHYVKYKIIKGDTLWDIARKFETSHKLIIQINDIRGADSLSPGITLVIPSKKGVLHTVVKGDSLTKLSEKYVTKTNRIIEQNPGSARHLVVGQKIFIPDAVARTMPVPDKQTRVAKKDVTEDSSRADEPAGERDVDAAIKSEKHLALGFMWPLRGRITSGFGSRSDPFSGHRQFHNGIDISAECGTPVKATADGDVIFAGWKDGYGKLVVIKHKNGYFSIYGHNSELKVNEGDAVQKGEVISLSGMTGAVTGAHLHFEIQKYQTPLNPLRMLK
jgi:murein DD-endopeptidase MepM/ murein hydrolase activator NlpD